MKIQKILVICYLLLLTGCLSVPTKESLTTVVRTPAQIIIKAPRNYLSGTASLNQVVFDMAENHCQEQSGAHAILESSWVVAFDGDYFDFECKKP